MGRAGRRRSAEEARVPQPAFAWRCVCVQVCVHVFALGCGCVHGSVRVCAPSLGAGLTWSWPCPCHARCSVCRPRVCVVCRAGCGCEESRVLFLASCVSCPARMFRATPGCDKGSRLHAAPQCRLKGTARGPATAPRATGDVWGRAQWEPGADPPRTAHLSPACSPWLCHAWRRCWGEQGLPAPARSLCPCAGTAVGAQPACKVWAKETEAACVPRAGIIWEVGVLLSTPASPQPAPGHGERQTQGGASLASSPLHPRKGL